MSPAPRPQALADRDCVPRHEGAPLDATALAPLLAELPGWTVIDGTRLERPFAFPDFARALACVDAIGAEAERWQHHPDLELGWGRVRVRLWTHAIGGLTEADCVLAAKIDRIVAAQSSLPRRGAD